MQTFYDGATPRQVPCNEYWTHSFYSHCALYGGIEAIVVHRFKNVLSTDSPNILPY